MLDAIKKALRTDPFLDKPLPIGLAANSAVLVPLFERRGDTGVLLIHRSSDGGPHSGQMGFPGGMTNPGDGGDLLRTALRESEEELGFDPGEVRIIGELSLRPTVVSGLVVKPYVGIIPWPCTLVPDPKEVQGTHITTIGHLQREVMPGHNPFNLPPPVYPVDDQPVWGLTARIIAEFLERLNSAIQD
ncbi:MAG: CoA pyrophosphatase [bacterium]|nr:CoA pyrophosphatase [bacterium]MDT8396209.1 CoA pyrophosphatase [bacterium]